MGPQMLTSYLEGINYKKALALLKFKELDQLLHWFVLSGSSADHQAWT